MDERQAIDVHWMRKALYMARYGASRGEVPVGAVLVRSGRFVSVGYNRPIETHDPTAHAEIVAIRRAAARIRNYRLPCTTLYATLEPCPMCIGALVHARLDRLVYGAADHRIGAVDTVYTLANDQSLNHRMTVCGGVLAEESSRLLKSFFAARR